MSASNTQFKDANAKTKTKREPTVESTAVIHVHRTCIARRDSLPLFNQNSFIMRANDESVKSAQVANSAEEIINKLSNLSFVEDLRSDLREIIDAYLLSEDETDYRDQRYSSFLWIDSLLKDIKLYQSQSQIKLVS